MILYVLFQSVNQRYGEQANRTRHCGCRREPVMTAQAWSRRRYVDLLALWKGKAGQNGNGSEMW